VRNMVVFLTIPPLISLFDLNGGITALGFRKTHMAEDYKVKPDYITETVFAVKR